MLKIYIFTLIGAILFPSFGFAAYAPIGTPSGSLQINDAGSFAGIVGTPIYAGDPTYGAKCNGVQLQDITTTATSHTISSGSYTFVSGDVGKLITIAGAGSGAAVLNTTIASVSGGNAVLTATAGTSISGTGIAYFGTDDQVAFNAATIAAAASGNVYGGSTVIAPAGICVLSHEIDLPSPSTASVSFRGQGKHVTDLKWISTSNMGGTGFKAMIFGISGNFHPYADMTIADMEIDMEAATDSTYGVDQKCIEIEYMQRPIFTNLYLHGSPATCLGVDYLTSGTITNNDIENGGRLQTLTTQDGDGFATELGAGYNGLFETTIIANNHFVNNHHYGIEVETSNNQANVFTVIANNVVTSKWPNAIGIEDNGATGAVITGNKVYGFGSSPIGFGIEVGPGPVGALGIGTQGIIANNQVQGFLNGIQLTCTGAYCPNQYSIKGNTVTSAGKYGIDIVGTGTNNIDRIIIDDNTVIGSQSFGIGVIAASASASTASNLKISNNHLSNNGQTAATSPQQAGIYIGMPVAGLDVTDNYAMDTGAGYQLYGMTVASGVTTTSSFVALNHFNNNVTAAFDTLGTISGIQFENYGDATSYGITAASTATLTNKTFDTAGTGNSWSINGTAITAVSGTGATVCMTNGCTMVAPVLGTPASGVATNLTGTASGLTSGSVTSILANISQGTNISLSGSGTSASPLQISASGGGSSNLGTSTSAASPLISGDATSGFYTAGAALVDVVISGVKKIEWSSAGEAITGTDTITSVSANSLAVGANGATNPVLNVDDSTSSVKTGVSIKGAASGGVTTITATGDSANAGVSLTAIGSASAVVNGGPTGDAKIQTNGITYMDLNQANKAVLFTPATSSSVVHWTYTDVADSAMTASTEINNIFWNSAIVKQHATGALALQRNWLINAPTYSFVGASTLTDGASIGFNIPGCGTNATCTNMSGLYHASTALTVTGTVTNSYPINVSADTGATNNYAAQLGGDIKLTTGSGNTPTVSSCGSGTITTGSTDNKGSISGITVATACTITFIYPLSTAPSCMFSSNAGIIPSISSISTSSVTTSMAALTGTLYYVCF